MEAQFIMTKLAEKFGNLLNIDIPTDTPACDEICDDCGRLYFEGISNDQENLRRSYDFKFRYYCDDWGVSLDKILLIERSITSSIPEIISNGTNKFYIRYWNVKSSRSSVTNASGVIYLYSEIEFSVLI